MVGFFESLVLAFIRPYFKPLLPHLSSLWNTILPQRSTEPSIGPISVHSVVTCSDILKVFKIILLDKSLIYQADHAAITTLGKRSLPGDLDVAPNGWDVVRPSKKLLSADPKIKSSTARRTKLMTKGKKIV
jgi:hypothetical protein